MCFISKRKVCNIVLAMMNENASAYNITIKGDIDEQQRRDAFMIQSGQLTMAVGILHQIEGRKKNGKFNRSAEKQHGKAQGTEEAVGQLH
jgi:hypothetical protein